MKKVDNTGKYLQLRKEYPQFVYQSYSFKIKKEYLLVKFYFHVSDKILFKPKLKIFSRDFLDFQNIDEETLHSLVFHLGMIELVSYWKATCSPDVLVRPFFLSGEQIEWWKKLYFKGLGEFFYLNGIEADLDGFMKIEPGHSKLSASKVELDENKVIVPIGGGKDSAVTLEMITGKDLKVFPFAVNPREATVRTIETAGFSIEESMIVERILDDKLLDLNEKGFLNGHTPFSALLAFTTVFLALLSKSKYVALSNESSANQSTVPGTSVNHQYSKSFEFEKDFNVYVHKFIHPDVQYFSFLRPLNELQIASLFSRFPWHFESFRSCNVGSKTDTWCGKCPKCLFTYTILSPFLSRPTLIRIFGDRLLNNRALSPVLEELSGIKEVKPFECVGTPEEVNSALKMTYDKFQDKDKLPFLLKEKKFSSFNNISDTTILNLRNGFNNEHLLPEHFLNILTEEMHD